MVESIFLIRLKYPLRVLASNCFVKNTACKEVVSNSPGLVDFAIGQVNSVFNLPDGRVIFF